VTPHPRATGTAPSGSGRFDERLSTPWWWSVPALVVAVLVYLDIRLGHPTWPAWPVAVLVLVLLAVALYRLGRMRVTVEPDERAGAVLRVGPASLPVRFVSAASVVPPADKQQALGPELRPRAYVLHRAWVRGMVRVDLNDPDDPTPYWLFSTKNPEALVQCLRAHVGSPGAGPA
jgi:hypothetical protein